MADPGPDRVRRSIRRRTLAARWLTALGIVAALGGLGSTIGRTLLRVPGLSTDTWAMVMAFSDYGLAAYAFAAAFLTGALLLRFGWARLVTLLVVLGLAAVHATWIVPRFVPDADTVVGPGRVTVLAENLLFGEADPDAVLANAAGADVLVLIELTEPAAAALTRSGIEGRFAYSGGGQLPQSGPTGTRIYSRFPILQSRRLNAAGGSQNWLVRVDAGALGPLNVVAAHPTGPVPGGDRWLKSQDNLREHLPRERTVVAGDFNAVQSHLTMRQLGADGFRGADAIVGAGWAPTFPAGRGAVPPLIAIDHILLSPDLTATTFETVTIPGSDHRGVRATVALSG